MYIYKSEDKIIDNFIIYRILRWGYNNDLTELALAIRYSQLNFVQVQIFVQLVDQTLGPESKLTTWRSKYVLKIDLKKLLVTDIHTYTHSIEHTAYTEFLSKYVQISNHT